MSTKAAMTASGGGKVETTAADKENLLVMSLTVPVPVLSIFNVILTS